MNDKDFVKQELVYYRECKKRVDIIELDRSDVIEGGIGVNYEGERTGKTNVIRSDTEKKGLTLAGQECKEEHEEKTRFIKRVETALDGLGPAERFIIDRKFCLVDIMCTYVRNGEIADVDIYTLEEFTPGKNGYKEIRDRAIGRLARLLKKR